MLGKIGNVIIGAGYTINDKNHKIVYPRDRFTKFLEVDATNLEQIQTFCHQYNFVPRDLTNGWQNGFIQEQNPIKTIVKHIIDGNVTEADLAKINQEMEGVNSLLQFIDNDALMLINETLSDEETGQGIYPSISHANKQYQVITTKRYPNSVASLYEELSNLILRKRLLKECRNCGKLFITTNKNPRKMFCSDECRDKYHKKKSYHAKK